MAPPDPFSQTPPPKKGPRKALFAYRSDFVSETTMAGGRWISITWRDHATSEDEFAPFLPPSRNHSLFIGLMYPTSDPSPGTLPKPPPSND